MRTVERWKKLPEFLEALHQIQGEVSEGLKSEIVQEVRSAACQIEILAAKAFQSLEKILDDPDSRNADRVQAAKIVLGQWQRQQPPTIHELEAVQRLVQVGWIPHHHLERLSKALDALRAEGQATFQNPSALPAATSEF